MNLLDHFSLTQIQTLRLHAELHDSVKQDTALEAKIEISFSPGKVADADLLNSYQIGAKIICRGILQGGSLESPLFTVECAMNAVYQATSSSALEYKVFHANHNSLIRQLYPLLQQKTQSMLKELGLSQISLPLDLVQSSSQTKAESAPADPIQIH